MSGRIFCGDSGSTEVMNGIGQGTVDLVVTSPPYNVSKAYDAHEDDMSPREYAALLSRVIFNSWTALRRGGRICVNVHHESGRNPAIPLGLYVQKLLEGQKGSLNRGTIVWDKGASAGPRTSWGSWQSPANPVLRGEYEVLYVYSKGDMTNPAPAEGVLPDISKQEFLDATKDVWRSFGRDEKITESSVDHPAPFPVGLARRLIQLYSWPGQTVFDPFFGSGTVGLAAEQTGRDWVGVDISEEYCKLAARRCAPFDGMEVPIEYLG